MNRKNLLKTGAQFKAKDTLGRTYRYEVVGIDLNDLLVGVGCSYIVLKDLDSGHQMGVEAAWFSNRTITEINPRRNIIEVPCTAGTLCAEAGGNEAYPEVFTYLRRPDGVEVDIVAVDGDAVIPDGVDPEDFDGQTGRNGGLKAYLYGDTTRDDYTKSYAFSAEELAIDFE